MDSRLQSFLLVSGKNHPLQKLVVAVQRGHESEVEGGLLAIGGCRAAYGKGGARPTRTEMSTATAPVPCGG